MKKVTIRNFHKLNNQKVFEELLKRKSERKGTTAFNDFEDRFLMAEALLVYIEKIEKTEISELFVNQARKNFIVNSVTAIEVYCRNIIEYFQGSWNEKGLNELLDVDFNLQKAYSLFYEANVSREAVIAEVESFQNRESINRIFSALTSKKFVDELSGYADSFFSVPLEK